MPLPTDPLLNQQWHLGNSVAGLYDLNVRGVWNPAQGTAYTGAGIRVVVIDNGFDFTHPDLAPNYDTGLDFDFVDSDLDPFGLPTDSHGTAVTGIIGADNNGTGAVGIAFDSSIVGYRTNNLITDFWLQNIRDAIHHAALSALGDVANISQGISNDSASEFGFGYDLTRFDEIRTSIGEAVSLGRAGLGMTIVKSAGNARADNYDVNADLWTNDSRQVVVGAVDQDGFVSSYSSYGAALLVSAFGTPGQVVTTDRVGSAGYTPTDFTTSFNGTSAAAPMVTGVVSLMYNANASLGWRDVQSILAVSARHVGSAVGAAAAGAEHYDWTFNGAKTWNGGGQHFSNDYGYGLIDAIAAVRLSETWLIGRSAATNGNQFTNTMDVVNSAVVIPDGDLTGTTFIGTAGFNDTVDRVTVRMTFSTTFLADLRVFLTSPEGTVSELIANNAGSADFNGTWTFESQAFRGERAKGSSGSGNWSVRVVDDLGGDVLTVTDLVITTWGSDTVDDRYVFTNEYSDYAGTFGHSTNVVDANGGTDIVNASAVSSNSTIRLDGLPSSIDGVLVSFAGMENAVGGDGGDIIYGNASANVLYGMRGNDGIDGQAGDDTIDGGFGSDNLIGGIGTDRSLYSFAAAAATIRHTSQSVNGWTIASFEGTDALQTIERADFSDGSITLRQARGNFNFGSTTNDNGATSDFLIYNAVGQFSTYMVQSDSTATSQYLGQAAGWAGIANGVGDFNGDGRSDFLTTKAGSILNYTVNSSGNVSGVTFLGFVPGWGVRGTGDFDNDGTLDILLQNGSTLAVWDMANGALNATVTYGGYAGWNAVAVGDFNRDGRADVFLQDTAGNLVEVFTNASEVGGTTQFLGTLPNWTIVGSGDFNGDGGSDLLIRDTLGNFVSWITASNGGIGAGYFLGTAFGWAVAGTGDYNGDGTSDVLLQNGGNLVAWDIVSGQFASTHLISNTFGGWTAVG